MYNVRSIAFFVAVALVVSSCGGASEAAASPELDLTYATEICAGFDDVFDRLLADQTVKTTEVQELIDLLPDNQAPVVQQILFARVSDIAEAVQVANTVDTKSTEWCGYPLVRVLFEMTLDCAVTRVPGQCTDARLSLDGVPTVQAQLEAFA